MYISILCLLISPNTYSSSFFFFNDTATTEIYTLSLHDALPIFVEREGQFLHGRRAGFADVIAANADGVPLRNMLGAMADGVHDQAEVRFRREQPFLLRDVFLKDVVLQRPAKALERNATPFRDRQIHGEDDCRRAVDR